MTGAAQTGPPDTSLNVSQIQPVLRVMHRKQTSWLLVKVQNMVDRETFKMITSSSFLKKTHCSTKRVQEKQFHRNLRWFSHLFHCHLSVQTFHLPSITNMVRRCRVTHFNETHDFSYLKNKHTKSLGSQVIVENLEL